MKHSTHPLQRASHTRHASFVPRRLLNITTTNLGVLFERRRPNLQGHKVNTFFLMHRWFRGRDSPDHCLGMHSTARYSQVRQWCCYPSTRPRRVHTRKAYTFCYHHTNSGERRYTPIPSYNPPMGTCSMSSESILLSRGGTRRLDMVRVCRAGRQAEN